MFTSACVERCDCLRTKTGTDLALRRATGATHLRLGRRVVLEDLRVKAFHPRDEIVANMFEHAVLDTGIEAADPIVRERFAEAGNAGLKVRFDVWAYSGLSKRLSIIDLGPHRLEEDEVVGDDIEEHAQVRHRLVAVLKHNVSSMKNPQRARRYVSVPIAVRLHLAEMCDDHRILGDVACALIVECRLVTSNRERDLMWREAFFSERAIDSEGGVVKATPQLVKCLAEHDRYQWRWGRRLPQPNYPIGAFVIEFRLESNLGMRSPLIEKLVKVLEVRVCPFDFGSWESEWVEVIAHGGHSLRRQG